jgi:hypothetical protein
MKQTIIESGKDRNGDNYTITGTKRCCLLKCVSVHGEHVFSLSGTYDYVKRFI